MGNARSAAGYATQKPERQRVGIEEIAMRHSLWILGIVGLTAGACSTTDVGPEAWLDEKLGLGRDAAEAEPTETPETPSVRAEGDDPGSLSEPTTEVAPVEATTALSNALVVDVQRMLARLGYDPGPIDGLWGERTSAAIRDYQRDHGLPVDGKPTEGLSVHGAEQTAAPQG
jgi:hypothetical protein